MFTETLKAHDDVVGISCKGRLSEDDLKQMHALLHDRLAEMTSPGLVVELVEFEGYENFAALGEDLKMDTAHRNDFGRIAVIGDRKWLEWGTALARLLTRSEMRWFKKSEADRALAWAREA